MTLVEFFRQYNLHDSLATKIEFSSQHQTLTLLLELCNFMQSTFREDDAEIVAGTLTFFNVDELAANPNRSIFDLKEGMDAQILQAHLIHPQDAGSPQVKIVLELADYTARRTETFVVEFRSSDVEWKPASGAAQ